MILSDFYFTSKLFPLCINSLFDDSSVNSKINSDGSYYITLDVPGIEEKDIDVEILPDNIVKVKGRRKIFESTKKINKEFVIPDNFDINSLKAKLKNGVLELCLTPKTPPSKRENKKIPIECA